MIETSSACLRVLIVGAGRRVQNNFLPALQCLSPLFEIVGIHARTGERMLPLARQWNIAALQNLAQVDFGQVDVVAISVPTGQNAAVMRQLLPHAARLRLVVDTPIAWNLRELADVEPLLGQFREVRVAEDFMNFPPYQMLRRAVDAGLIGRPLAFTLLNTGYLYHGLALARSFVNFAPVISSSKQGASPFSAHIAYRFTGGFRASLTGPYRQHDHGGAVLEGDSGIITEVAGDEKFGRTGGRKVYHLTRQYENGTLRGYTLEHDGAVVDRLDMPEYAKMQAMHFDDKSELNLLRGCGLMKVFQALITPDINSRYGFSQALYDSFASQLAKKGWLPLDPLAVTGKSFMNVVIPLARLRRQG